MTARRAILALYLGLALCLALFHGSIQNFGPRQDDRAERHAQVLSHAGEAPWTYRLLVPTLAEIVRPVPEGLGASPKDALEASYLLWQFLFTAALFLAFHRYLTIWLDPVWALAANLFFIALQGPAFAYHWFQPDSLPDLLVWVAAAVLSLGPPGRRDFWLFPLVLVGAVNRESALFLVAIHGAFRWGREPTKDLCFRGLALAACWLVVFLGVRRLVGSHGWAHGGTPWSYFLANITNPDWLLYAASFFGVLWLAPFVGWGRQPAGLRRLAVLMIPYLALQFAFGRIREVRLLLPLSLVLIPLGALWLRSALLPRGERT